MKDLAEVKEFIKQTALGIFGEPDQCRPWQHISLWKIGSGWGMVRTFLVGHISKANPQWQGFKIMRKF